MSETQMFVYLVSGDTGDRGQRGAVHRPVGILFFLADSALFSDHVFFVFVGSLRGAAVQQYRPGCQNCNSATSVWVERKSES